MELPAQSLSHANLPKPPSFPITFHSRTSLFFHKITIPTQLKFKPRNYNKLGVVFASSSEALNPPPEYVSANRWLLEPVGDGDSRHIGYKVAMPGAFEIESDELTVGRVPDKADMVIPVATVSALHARIQKKGGNLLVTDLDSTNGTFIDEKRLSPGVASIALPGSYVTFGDTHLAIFRVSKLKPTLEAPEESEAETDTSANQTT